MFIKKPTPVINLKNSIDLDRVRFTPSLILWRAQLVIYSAMLLFAFIALLPFFITAFYWILVWLVFAFLIGVAIRKSWRVKNAAPRSVEVKQNNWHLITGDHVVAVTIGDEVVIWSWVIVLPLREHITGKQHYIVVLVDSLDKEDWRRLRVWLSTCLTRSN